MADPLYRTPHWLAAALFVAIGFGASGCMSTAEARRSLDRPAVKEMVAREAVNMGVPPSLALAVAHAESYFDPKARSSAGARGVMQIMPATARGEYGINPDRLWEPRINIRLGLHFLNRLVKRYRGRVDLALSYYNGGSAVGTWPNARIIPATARYVKKVRKLQRHYRTRLAQGRRI
ncbi:MAG: transglycosylase SLT domain-containing protein [Alphaproteobacteria bacterium]|nr:transglycosylase SLT domain-containing protein [Alphaproteobacteria bacterium]